MQKEVAGIVYGRDDAQHLRHSLESMIAQTHPFSRIIYVDDGSEDDSVEIADGLDVEVIALTHRHESWAGTPSLAHLPNTAIRQLHDEPYFLINGADIILAQNYVETLLAYMKRDSNLVLTSGIIKGEPWRSHVPKGAGRIHQTRFWRRYIKEYPFMYAWEAFPIYKALALGYKVLCTPTATMRALRETVRCKANWGYGIKQLGYRFPNALARCLVNILYEPVESIRMLVRYLTCPYPVYDKKVARYIQRVQGPPWRIMQNLAMTLTLRQAHTLRQHLSSQRPVTRPRTKAAVRGCEWLAQEGKSISGSVLHAGSGYDTLRYRRFFPHATRYRNLDMRARVKPDILADMTDMPNVPSCSEDCVLVHRVFCQVSNIPDAIREVHRVLKPRGILLASFVGPAWHSPIGRATFTARQAKGFVEKLFTIEDLTTYHEGGVLRFTYVRARKVEKASEV